MEEYKGALASRAVWGGIITLGASAAAIVWGVKITADDQARLVELGIAVVAGVGGVMSIVGRIWATKRIGRA